MPSPKALVRKKWFWVGVGLLVAYTLFGFLVAPGLVSKRIVGTIAQQLGRRATLRDVDIDPWALSARLEGFDLRDPDGESFAAFEELFVDFQVSSLVRRAYTFKTVRLASLHGQVRLMADETPNFQDILDRMKAKPAAPKPAKRRTTPRLLMQRVEIHDMRLQAANLAHASPESIAFTGVNLTLEDFTTIPNRDGRLSAAATGQGGGRWEWSGTVTFEPMHSSGVIAIQGEKLPESWAVIHNRVAWEIPSGVLDLQLHYGLEFTPDGVTAAITDGSLGLDRLAVRAKGHAPDLVRLDSLRVRGVEVRFPERAASVQRIGIDGVHATAWLDAVRQLNWQPMLASPILTASGVAGAPHPATKRETAPAWTLRIDELALAGGAAHFVDSTVTPPFDVEVEPVDIVLRDFTSAPGARCGLDLRAGIAGSGTLAVRGQAGVQPLAADLQVNLAALPLTIFQPYVSARAKLDLQSGDARAEGRLVAGLEPGAGRPDVRFEGRVGSSNFHSQDSRTHERLLAWKELDLQGVVAGTHSLHIASVDAAEPYGRIIVFQDRRSNIHEVLGIPPRDTTQIVVAAPPAAKPPALSTRIDIVRLRRGTADFADLSLLVPFAAGIVDLDGEVRGLSSEALAHADVELDGGLVPAGAVHVRGQINPLSGDLYTDLTARFQDFEMPALSPYTGQFLGRKVDQGKLSLDLQYKVSKRELAGQNKIVLDQLELGEKVDSPEATSLPVGLAVALLKDRNGVIDLDLPVHGNLGDPKFRIWNAVFDVLRNIVVKLITAPFSLLGRLVGWGGDGEELSRVCFEPGQRQLGPAEHDKVVKLAEALAQRPQLRLEVRGSYNPEADARALRAAKFAAQAEARALRNPTRYAPTLGGAGWSPRLFRDLYVEQFGAGAVDELEKRFQVPLVGRDGKPHPKKTRLDEAAFYTEVRAALEAAQAVDASELRILALERSRAVKSDLVQSGSVDEARIFLLEVEAEGKLVEGRIQMELKLGS